MKPLVATGMLAAGLGLGPAAVVGIGYLQDTKLANEKIKNKNLMEKNKELQKNL